MHNYALKILWNLEMILRGKPEQYNLWKQLINNEHQQVKTFSTSRWSEKKTSRWSPFLHCFNFLHCSTFLYSPARYNHQIQRHSFTINIHNTLLARRVSEYQERYNELENCSATVEEACSNFTISEDVSADSFRRNWGWRKMKFYKTRGLLQLHHTWRCECWYISWWN